MTHKGEAGSVLRRDAAEHRRRVLHAARNLFAEQGVEATSMVEIARAAGVGQGTLYRRFAHKGELCIALMDDNWRAFRAEVESRFSDAGEPALAQIAFLLDRLIRFNEGNGPLLAAVQSAAWSGRKPESDESPVYGWLREQTTAILERGVARGEIAPIDIECCVDYVLAPLAIDLYTYQRGRGMTPERIGAAVRQLLFDGLRRAPADESPGHE
jgi:AcrR family transcriptional regulator